MNRDTNIVLHAFPVWLPQTQPWMYQQVKHLPKSIEAHVVCEYVQNIEQFGLPNLHCLQDESRLKYYWQKGLRRLGIKQHLDYLKEVALRTGGQVLHSHFGYIGWANLGAIQSLDIRHVTTFYGEDVNRFPVSDKRWFDRYQELFSRGDLFLCEGPHMKQCLVQLGCPPEKITVHHLGVEIERLPFRPRKWRKGDVLRVLIASSFREKKGIPYALEALAALQTGLEVQITLIGDATVDAGSQREKGRILKILKEGGLADKVTLLGFLPHSELLETAYDHHVFMLPSVTASDGDTEGGAPVVLSEMLATGMPVISTTHCDIPGVVDYGIENWLVAERDVQALVDRVQWLVDHASSWDEFLFAGRCHIEQEFNASIQGHNLGLIYRGIVEGQSDTLTGR